MTNKKKLKELAKQLELTRMQISRLLDEQDTIHDKVNTTMYRIDILAGQKETAQMQKVLQVINNELLQYKDLTRSQVSAWQRKEWLEDLKQQILDVK